MKDIKLFNLIKYKKFAASYYIIKSTIVFPPFYLEYSTKFH